MYRLRMPLANLTLESLKANSVHKLLSAAHLAYASKTIFKIDYVNRPVDDSVSVCLLKVNIFASLHLLAQ